MTAVYCAFIALSTFEGHSGHSATAAALLEIAAISLLLAGIPEELLFRVLLQTRLEVVLGRWNGILGATALFALMHVPQTYFLTSLGKLSSNPTLAVGATVGAVLISSTLTGLVWGYLWSRYRNAWLNVAIHSLNDGITFAAVLLGFSTLS